MPNVLFQVVCVAPRTHLEQTAPVKRRQWVPIGSNLRALELRFGLTAAAGVAASSILGAIEFLPAQWHHQLQMSCSSYSCSYLAEPCAVASGTAEQTSALQHRATEKHLCEERYHRCLWKERCHRLSLSAAALMFVQDSRLIHPLSSAASQQHLGHRSGVRSFVASLRCCSLRLLERRFQGCSVQSKAGQRLSSSLGSVW